MSAAVIGVWEVGYSYPLLEAEVWRHPLREFGVTEWVMTPTSGVAIPELRETNDLQGEIMAQSERRRVVFVDEAGATRLPEYQHPEHACYVFGRSSFSPLRAYGPSVPHDSVIIPTRASTGLLWAHQAAVVVLLDREVKRGRDSH